MAPAKHPAMLWWIAGAFAVVAIAFMVATLTVEREATTIERDANSLRSNALPSVERLTAARTLLRRIEATAALVSVEPSPHLLEDLSTARHDLTAALGDYLELPGYPGERDLYTAVVEPALARLDRAIDGLSSVVGASGSRAQLAQAFRAIDDAVESVDQGLRKVVDLNAVQERTLTTHIVTERQASMRLAALLDGGAAIIAIIAAALCIGAAQRYARERERDAGELRTRAQELDTVALRVAHDVLGPLATVNLSLATLGSLHGDDASRRVIARAQRSLIRSRDVASGIYEFARSGAAPATGARAPLRATIGAALEDTLEAEGQNPPQVVVEPFEDCDVACEAGVLYSMLANVLANAVKFSRGSAERRITIRVLEDEQRVRVEVADSGPGIPAGLEGAVFEPYVRGPGVAQPGLGLGLATVKRYATAYGGSIGARRAEGGGALVWFELPRAPASGSSRPEPPQPSAATEHPPPLH